MSRTNDGASEHRRVMRAVRRVRDQGGWTLAAAEVAWRNLPSESLAPEALRAILATVLQRQAADPGFLVWQAWSEGVYWDQAGGDRDTYWTPIVPIAAFVPDSCQIIGVVTGSESMEGTTPLPTCAAGAARMDGSLGSETGVAQGPVLSPEDGSDSIVYEVLLDCRGLDRRQTSDLVRGLVEWNACLETRDLDARQWTWRHELRCDHADCEQGDAMGRFPEWF